MKISKCFKVTTKEMKSCGDSLPNFLKDLVVTYCPEHWIFPHYTESALFCFNELEKAREFVVRVTNRQIKLGNIKQYDSLNWVIWEAEALNMRPKVRIIKITKSFSFLRFKLFWSGISKRAWIKSLFRKDYCYCVADAIKLKRIVS